MLYRTHQIAALLFVLLLSTAFAADVTCPNGSTAATVAQCPCINEAVMSGFIIATSAPAAIMEHTIVSIDAVWGVAMSIFFDYKVPAGDGACANTVFPYNAVQSFSWAVFDNTNDAAVTLRLATLPTIDKQRIVFPAWTFTQGSTYRVEVTVTDQNGNAVKTIGKFTAVSPVPSGTADCPLDGDDNLYPHLDQCKCAGDAEIDVMNIENGGTQQEIDEDKGMVPVGMENWVNPTFDATFAVVASYETPATFTPEDASNAHCKSGGGTTIEFDNALGVKWTLVDVTNTSAPADVTIPVGSVTTLTIPANTLTLGNKYTLTVNFTGFYGLWKVKTVSFIADHETITCPDASKHGHLKLCPCVSKAVFTHIIKNSGNTLPYLVTSESAQTFTHETTWIVPADDADVACQNLDFTSFVTDLVNGPNQPDWKVFEGTTQVQTFTGLSEITLTNAFTAGSRYTLTTVFYDAVTTPHTDSVEFIADFSATPITCPGSAWQMSKPKHCPCSSQATYTTPPTLTSPQFKLIFDRSIPMTVTGAVVFTTGASATPDLGIACVSLDFSEFLTYAWTSTPAVATGPLAWDLATETTKVVAFPDYKFDVSTKYELAMTATFPETSSVSSGTALNFLADDCVHSCPDHNTGKGYCVSLWTNCPCALHAALEELAITKTGAVEFPRVIVEGDNFGLTSSGVARVPASYDGLPEYEVLCPSLTFATPTRRWQLNDVTESEDEVLLPEGIPVEDETIVFTGDMLLEKHIYTAKVTFYAFNGKTDTVTTPTFVAETCTVTCPGNVCVGANSRCPCVAKAEIKGLKINNGNLPKVIMAADALTLDGATTYTVPSDNIDNEHGITCKDVDFTDKLVISWNVRDITDDVNVPASSAMVLQFPANTFTVGHKYRATVSFTDVFGVVHTSAELLFQADVAGVVCPDAVSNVELNERCPCVEEAEIHDAAITRGSECPPDFVYYNAGLVLHTDAKYTTLRCSEESCRDQDFYGRWKSREWKLEDTTDGANIIVMTSGITTQEIRFPEHTFTADHTYVISVTYVDLRNSITTVSHTFTGKSCDALCPDGTCEPTHKWCRCINDAKLENPTIEEYQLQTTVANMVDVALAWGLDANATYVTPSVDVEEGCANVRFDRYWWAGSQAWMRPPTKFPMASVAWAVYDVTLLKTVKLPDTVLINETRIEFPANLFTVGHHYTATVTFSDSVMKRETSKVFPFEVVAATPVITMTTKATLSTIPRNIKIVSSVTDGYADGSPFVWNCKTTTNTNCPTNLTDALNTNGTRNGVFITGPIAAGSYEIWMTYRGVTGASVTVTVECSDAHLRADWTCPTECTYTCPDATCSSKLGSCRCALDATITDPAIAVWPSPDAQSTAMTFTASANYRHAGSCSAFDFNPFMTVNWYLFKGENREPEVLPVSIVSTALKFLIPDNYLTEGATYTLSVVFTDVNGVFGNSATYKFTVKTFTPYVSVTQKGSVIVTGPTNINVSAVVTDKHADNTVGTWSCLTAANTNCPSSVTNALNAGKNTGVFIGGPIAAGTYLLRLTYKGVTSNPLTVQVKAVEVPRVSILAATSSLSQTSLIYTTSQTLSLAASVRFANKTTLEWTVNDVSYGSGAVLSLPASLLRTTTTTKPRSNVIRVRATSVNDTTLFGEASLDVLVAPVPKLYLTSLSNVNTPSESLLVLSDAVKLEYEVADAPSSVTLTFEVGYLVDGTKSVVVRTQSLAASFVTPMVDVTATSMDFFVDMRINGVLIETVQAAYSVRLPALDVLCSLQGTEVEATTSAEANKKRAAIVNLGYLAANCPSSASQSAVLDNLASLQSDDVAPGPVVAAVFRVLDSMTNDTVSDADVDEKVTNYLIAVASKVSASDSATFMQAVKKLNASAALNTAMETVAMNIAGEAEYGQEVTVESSDKSTVLVGTKLTASSAQGMSLSTSSSSISGNLVPGVAEDSVVTVTSMVRTINAYGDSQDGLARSSDVVSYSVGVNGAAHEVKDLEDVLLITFNSNAGKGAVCQYYDSTTSKWSTEGTWLYAYNKTTVTCATTHLTTFTTFGSSATTIVASLCAVVVAVVMQLWAQ